MHAGQQLLLAGSGLILGLSTACIFPDTDIDFVSANPNTHAVHFYEAVAMERADRCECRNTLLGSRDISGEPLCEGPEDPSYGELCPLPPLSALPRFLDPSREEYKFCGCAEQGQRDNNALLPIDDLYVQDLDRDVDGNPDTLYAALLLDMPNDATANASLYVAYRQVLDPRQPLLDIAVETKSLVPNVDLLERPDPQLRRVFISHPDHDTVDLCNDAGTGEGRLSPGFHTITLVVTDRFWLTDSSDDDQPTPDITKDGVPDVANSATWATRQYVFSCVDEESDPSCQCVEE